MPHSAHPANLSALDIARSFLGIFVALSFLLVAVAVAHYYTSYQTERATKEAGEALNVELSRQMIVTDIASVVSDLLILAEQVRNEAAEIEGEWFVHTGYLRRVFGFFSSNKGVYDQVRYLDAAGNEAIRVNYADGKAIPVPEHRLQNKAHRYYVREAMRLQPGEIYISPMDLNVEGGRIERPLKPVMRFATPVFDSSRRLRGIVILNYMGERLIRHFKQAAANISDHVQLLNNEGYWLSSPEHAREWGFMFGNEQRFDLRYPLAWSNMTQSGSGQVLTPGGFFSFSSVAPIAVAKLAADPTNDLTTLPADLGSREYHWKIVSHVPLEALAPLPGLFVQRHAMLYGSMLVLLLLVAYLLAYSHTRHRWAKAQTQYESRFRQTLENIQLAAVSVDERGRVGFCNEYFCQLSGWKRSEVIGRNWIETFVPEGGKDEIRGVLARLRTPERFPTRFECELETRDGGKRLIAWNNTLSYEGGDGVRGVTSIGEDITEKRRNEEQVRKLSMAVEQSPAMVVITDRRGLIEYVNPKFTQVTGYEPAEVVGRNPRLLKSGETSPGEYRELWQTIVDGGEWQGEFHNRRKNGELYWEAATISALRNHDGEITNFLSVKEDITERKRLERIIEERNRELVRNEALAAMGRMSSMIAHDLRNPLSSVKMGLQIFGKRLASGDGELQELCQIGLEQVHYMEHILSDMLSFSRPEAMRADWVRIDKLLSSSVGMLQDDLNEQGVKVYLKCDEGLPAVPGDTDKLRQLFTNLITNAAQAVADNPMGERRLDIDTGVHLDADGTFVRIRVCDNGYGLGEATQEQLFEPFYTTRSKGTGLGLAIVRQITEQHQGSIDLVQRETGGLCAIVVLPTLPASGNGSTRDRTH